MSSSAFVIASLIAFWFSLVVITIAIVAIVYRVTRGRRP